MAINEQYIDNIAQEQLLSDEEERQLADRIKVGDARALEQLTKANLRFVVSLAHHYRGHGLDEDDLVSKGNIALMHAAAQFDGSRGLRFVVFAAPFIRQAMERAIEEQNVLEDTSRKATRRGERTAPRPLSLDQSIPVGSNSTFTLHSIIEDANAIPIDGGLDRGVVREQLLRGARLSRRPRAQGYPAPLRPRRRGLHHGRGRRAHGTEARARAADPRQGTPQTLPPHQAIGSPTELRSMGLLRRNGEKAILPK